MLTLLERQAGYHIPGGKYFTKPEDVYIESASVSKHNKLLEFVFGQFDFLLKYRPNATVLCNEAYLLYSHNSTNEWLENLDHATTETYISDSRKKGYTIRKLFHERLNVIKQKTIDAL